MLLSSVKIKGFKSFPDAIELELERGITAVVGPNGCGKSNIADSINWALGEQSPSSLRGKRMEQMIFNGSTNRKASGVAEVAVTLAVDGDLPALLDVAEQERGLVRDGGDLPSLLASTDGEVTITRRMYRDTQSEYLLNGRSCRLRDIQDLLMALGIGSRACSIVEQDRINSLLAARPVDRRVLIEDAAGITKFKLNKHLTQLKLQRTGQNLERIEDLLAEQEVHLRRLRRQAARARRYRRMLAEMREIETAILASRHSELRQRQREGDRYVREAEEKLAAATAGLARAESSHAALRQQIDELRAEQVAARDRHYHGSLDTDRDTNRLKHLRDGLDDLFQRSEEAQARLTENKRRFDERGERLEAERRRATRLEEEKKSAAAQFELHRETANGVDTDLSTLRDEREDLQLRLAAVRENLATKRTRLDALSNEERRLVSAEAVATGQKEGLSASISEIADSIHQLEHRGSDLDERLLENAGAGKRLEDNLEALKGELEAHERRLETLRLSHHEAEAQYRALREIEERHEGIEEAARAILDDAELRELVRPLGIVADWIEPQAESATAAVAAFGRLLEAVVVEDEPAATRGIELLRERGIGRATFVPLASLPTEPPAGAPEGDLRRSLLATGYEGGRLLHIFPAAGLAPTLPEALRASAAAPGKRVVTPSGDVAIDGKLLRGGSQAAGQQILARRARLEELRERSEGLDDELRRFLGRRDELDARRAELLGQQEELRRAAELLRVRLAELGALRKSAGEERDRLADDLAQKEKEIAALAAQRQEGGESMATAATAIAEGESEAGRLARELESLDVRLQAHNDEAGEARRLENELKAAIGVLGERARAAHAGAESLQGDREELRVQIDASRAELGEIEELRLGLLHEIEATERGLPDKIEANEACKRSLDELEDRLSGLAGELRTVEEEVKSHRGLQQAAQQELEGYRLESRERVLELEHLRERAAGSLGLDSEALDESPPGGGDEPIDLEKAQGRLEELKDASERMGPVNLLAGEEYERHQQRHRFLADQRQDVVDSIASLDKVIQRIERVSRRRFREAFQAINDNFHATFRRLFGGGRAEMALEDGDVLEAGVDILVQPPGKRTQSATLLSGGEKSLAAFALIMAILEFRPSPFIVLDEADAALDEPNIRRVAAILSELRDATQFIMITHNKATMEIADRLYGVTMEEPGVSKLVSVKFN